MKPAPRLDRLLVAEARAVIAGRAWRTPVERSLPLSDQAGVPVFLKLECFQRTGSFKIRGALFAMSRLTDAEKAMGVVTCSAGNHGKAVAYVARELAIPAEIHVPRNVDEAKYRAIVALGAVVVRSGTDLHLPDSIEEAVAKSVVHTVEHQQPAAGRTALPRIDER